MDWRTARNVGEKQTPTHSSHFGHSPPNLSPNFIFCLSSSHPPPTPTTISPPLPDYYAVLGVAPSASDGEIARAWRRLVLVSHPDKRENASASASPTRSDTSSPNGEGGSTPDIRLVNEARAVLSDPIRRQEFDLARRTQPPPPTVRVREYVSLEAFTPYPEDEPERFALGCRCGHEYVISVEELEDGVDVVGCPGCGEYIGVEYDVVEE